MIISHKHKFVFIKTRKTAGTSIEVALSTLCGSSDILTPLSGKDEKYRRECTGIGAQNFLIDRNAYLISDYLRLIKNLKLPKFQNHDSAERVRMRLGKSQWDQYFTFCFERCPEDKIVSHYQWLKMVGKCTSVVQYIDHGFYRKIQASKMYLDKDQQLLVDKVFKLEYLSEGLGEVQQHLGLDTAIELPVRKTKRSKMIIAQEREQLLDAFHDRLWKHFEFELALYSENDNLSP
jgi:hypothetical protein